MNQKLINTIQNSGDFSYLDIHFAKFITRLNDDENQDLFLAAALVSSYTREGNVCINIPQLAENLVIEDSENAQRIVCPEADKWVSSLQNCSVIGMPGEFKPLILDAQSRLYLHRYWQYQQELAESINTRVLAKNELFDEQKFEENLNRYFPENASRPDWQKIAAYTSLTRKFCVISGGPGTGKTTTVAKIIALLLESSEGKRLRIALTAPTGKAAARLKDSIKSVKRNLDCPEQIKDAIPDDASTIHRLLGSIPDSPYFRFNSKNLLNMDVLIVDEASMIDLALMSKLIQALPLEARLILLGDKDQLASVESGAALGDICDSGKSHSYSVDFTSKLNKIIDANLPEPSDENYAPIQDCIVQLNKNFRFSENSGIGAISRSINSGEVETAIDILTDEKYADIQWQNIPSAEELPIRLKNSIIDGFKSYLKASNIEDIFREFEKFKILCALREGPYGVSALNALIERLLHSAKLIDSGKTWYHGRPVMITRNDYYSGLFNGDVGITLRDPDSNNDLRVFFRGDDDNFKKFHPFRLPAHETVYAMTVHKSQGSEFDHVSLILTDRDSPILTCELIYTAITRAKQNVAIWGKKEIFMNAIKRRIERTSGLRDLLWQEK